MNDSFWRDKRVLITGHTGFKGSWLSLWLQELGAHIGGYAKAHTPGESLLDLCGLSQQVQSVYADIRDREKLHAFFRAFRPEIVFHLAAQPLVRHSYIDPVETYDVNVMGTVHLLETARKSPSCRAVVNITSDKCYENREWSWAYRECDAMGGHDPYSSSKGCSELVTTAYRRSFYEAQYASHPVGLASARAGNVIGGGDFSKDRIIPDVLTSFIGNTPLYLRNPDAIRPWQHVLEPLCGYLMLAEKLWTNPAEYSQGWNFGPDLDDVRPVRWIVERLCAHWNAPISWMVDAAPKVHEAQILILDSTKARRFLGWRPRWALDQSIYAIVEWQRAYLAGIPVREVMMRQIAAYEHADSKRETVDGASPSLSSPQPRHASIGQPSPA